MIEHRIILGHNLFTESNRRINDKMKMKTRDKKE